MSKPPKAPRVPYADRPEVVREFCSCAWSWSSTKIGVSVPLLMLRRDPDCPLHGDVVEEAPF